MTEVAETTYVDLWDKIDEDQYWFPLPATTAATYLSGMTDLIYVRRDEVDANRWWVSITNELGMTDYDTLEEAKAAGDEIIARYQSDQLADITVDLDVSPDEWDVELGDEIIVVKSKVDDDIQIHRVAQGLWCFEDTSGPRPRTSRRSSTSRPRKSSQRPPRAENLPGIGRGLATIRIIQLIDVAQHNVDNKFCS